MKIKIAASSAAFPHLECGTEVDAQISLLESEDNIHQLIIGDKKHIIQITDFKFINNERVLISCFITDNENVGKISLAFEYGE